MQKKRWQKPAMLRGVMRVLLSIPIGMIANLAEQPRRRDAANNLLRILQDGCGSPLRTVGNGEMDAFVL